MNFSKEKAFIFISIFMGGVLSCLPTSHAYQPKEGNILAKLGIFASQTRFGDSNSHIETPWQSGLALFAEGDMYDKGGIEIGIMNFHKIFIRQQANQFVSEKTELMHITMGYRHWFNTWLSGSLMFYSEYTMGDPEVVHTDFAPAASPDTSARDTTEYGFDITAQAILFERQRYSIVLDGRYSISVTSKDHEYADHYGAFLAFQYFVQEKQPKKKRSKGTKKPAVKKG